MPYGAPMQNKPNRRTVKIAAAAVGIAGAMAIANALRTRQALRANPPVGRFVELDGVRLHYLEKGKGPPILLIHGNGVMLQDWLVSGLFDELAKTHRAIAVDRPGSGYSVRPRGIQWTPERQAELLAGLLEELDAAPAVVVGHSFGTLVAAALALDHPDKVRAAALIGGLYFPELRVDALMVAGSAIPGWGDVVNYTMQPLAAESMQKGIDRAMFSPAPVPDAWRRDFSWAMAARPSRMRAGASDAMHILPATRRLAERYNEISVPVALLAGSGDRIVDPSHSHRLHELLPHSRLTLVEGAGHMAHHPGMREVAAAVRLL